LEDEMKYSAFLFCLVLAGCSNVVVEINLDPPMVVNDYYFISNNEQIQDQNIVAYELYYRFYSNKKLMENECDAIEKFDDLSTYKYVKLLSDDDDRLNVNEYLKSNCMNIWFDSSYIKIDDDDFNPGESILRYNSKSLHSEKEITDNDVCSKYKYDFYFISIFIVSVNVDDKRSAPALLGNTRLIE
jgi:hypothetical protein